MSDSPLLQQSYDNGFSDAIEETNWYVEQLTVAWGSIAIACDQEGCVVGDGIASRVYEASTLLKALRLAAEKETT